MALSTKVGSFNTGTGAIGSTVVVNDVGFQPKVIFFWWNGRTGAIDASGRATHQRGFGAATSSTDRRYVTSLSQDTPTAMLTNTMQGNAACIGLTTTGDAIDGLMDVQSMDSGGFTLVVDDVFVASYRIHYLALGGTHISNVSTGQFTGNAAGVTGNQDVTSLSFQPDCVLFFTTGQTTANNTVRADSRMMIGIGPTSHVWSGGSNDAAATSQAMTYCRQGECIALFNTGLTGMDDRASYSLALSNGFRVNWSEVTVGGAVIFFVAMKGDANFTIGNFTTQTNTSTPIVESGFGVSGVRTPKAALLLSACSAANAADTPTDDDELSIGAFTSASARVAMSTADDDAAGTAIVSTGVSHDQVYQNLNANTGAVEGEMDVQSVDSNGFTLIMDDADPSAAFVWYVAFCQEPSFQTVSGEVTPSGAISKQDNKTITGDITPSGSIIKDISKFFSGVLTLAGDLVAEFQAAGNEYFQTVSGGLTPSGALDKITSKFFSGEITPSGDTIKSTLKNLSGALSSIVGTLISNAGYVRSFDGNITPSGEVNKQDSKTLSGSVTPSGSLTASSVFIKILEGALTLTGAISKQTNKLLSGSLTSAGTLLKNTLRFLTGTLTFSGTVIKLITKFFSGIISLAGDLIADFQGGAQTFFKDLEGSINPSGSLSKIASKIFSGNIIPTGNLSATSVFLKILEGTLSIAGNISKNINKELSGSISLSGSINKFITKIFAGVLNLAGNLVALFGVSEAVEKVYLLGSRILRVEVDGALSRIKTLTGRAKRVINLDGKRDLDIE